MVVATSEVPDEDATIVVETTTGLAEQKDANESVKEDGEEETKDVEETKDDDDNNNADATTTGETNERVTDETTKETEGTTINSDIISSTAARQQQFQRSNSNSFVRVHDLDGMNDGLKLTGSDVSSASLHACMKPFTGRNTPKTKAGIPIDPTAGLVLLDDHLPEVLNHLTQLAFSIATDDSDRFVPGRETNNILKRRAKAGQPATAASEDEWPVTPWHVASTTTLPEILIWQGHIVEHENFGHDWPIVKARGVMPRSPRVLLEFLWDSSTVPLYNSMSQGRDDVVVLQDNVDMTAAESPYGFAGCAKVLRARNKLKMVPRIIETLSLLHGRALEPPLAPKGTYMLVNRSLWEKDTGDGSSNTADSSNNKTVRSEMLLGVTLLRPICNGEWCEMTTVTHMYSPGVTKLVARTAAPISAAKILRDIQACHPMES